jgi:ADP-ribose pyrophosphatase YjhB (NUDIX family)
MAGQFLGAMPGSSDGLLCFCTAAGCGIVSEANQQAHIVQAGRRRWHGRLARVLRRFPWMARLVQQIYRLKLERVTLGAVGVLLDPESERVLLVEHVFHSKRPWGLPGGWVGRGEDPTDTVRREFAEETGLRVRVLHLLLIERPPDMRAHFNLVYLCALDGDGQSIRLNNELLSYQWAAWDALPPLMELHRAAIQAALDMAPTHQET